MKSNFRDWKSDAIDEVFGITQVRNHPLLDEWLLAEYEIVDSEQDYLNRIQEPLIMGVVGWNETELENKFISPLFMLAQLNTDKFGYFLERDLTATIGDYELWGRIDGLIATGVRSPKLPFFCLNEYKRQTDPDGEPQGQALIAMLAAQHLRNDQRPVYGCYVIGRDWSFMVLDGNQYAVSQGFGADGSQIQDIYRILRGLKTIVEREIVVLGLA